MRVKDPNRNSIDFHSASKSHPKAMASQLAKKLISLGGRGFSPGVKLPIQMGFSP
jgi:hypothetical protein